VDLVAVLETSDPFVMNLAKATLEDAGIEYLFRGNDVEERGVTGMTPMGAGPSQLLVESAREAAAREALEPLRNPEPSGGTEEETASEPGPEA
jgi:hypothetical protein